MKIVVEVKLHAKVSKIQKLDGETYRVFVKSAPIEGKANEEIISLLAKYFNIPKSSVDIVKGTKGKRKIADINF